MYRPKSGTLSVLERAQGQLSGKRFGKKKTAPSTSYQEDVIDDEDDELKGYLSQLKERTSRLPAKANDGDSDENYQPIAHSTPLKTGSQFLKSSRKSQESTPHPKPGSAHSRVNRPSTVGNGQLHNMSDEISSADSSERDENDTRFPRDREIHSSQNFRQNRVEFIDDSNGHIPTEKPGGSPFVPKLKKSAAFERIMSNLISDEEDVEELIREPPRQLVIPSDKPKLVPPPGVDGDTTESIVSLSDEEQVLAPKKMELGRLDQPTNDKRQKNILRVQDLQPIGRNDTKDDVASDIFNKTDEKPFDRSDAAKEIANNLFTRVERDGNSTKKTKAPEVDVVVEDLQSATETEIKTVSATETSARSPDKKPGRSDDETEADISLSSSIASHHSQKSPRSRSSSDSESVSKRTVSGSFASQTLSTGPISDSQRSDTVSISMKPKSPDPSNRLRDVRKSSEDLSEGMISESVESDAAKSAENTRSSRSSYSEEFTSDTNRSPSTLSSGTITPSSVATVKHSPTPPATPAPPTRKSRLLRVHVTDTGVQTTDHLHGHWIFDRTSSGQTIDVTELLKDYRTSAVPSDALQAVSSVDYSTMLLHQTMKLQFQQTQQSIQQMLHVHQSLLESVQSDYKYTTLEDTKAYIRQQREKREKKDNS